MDDVRLLLKYLTSKDTTALLEVFYDDSNVVAWAAIGGWTELNLQKIANNRTIGITAVFSAVHPFALSDLYTVTKTITTTSNVVIDIDTDDNKPVYPCVTIKQRGAVSDIKFTNVHTNLLNQTKPLPSVEIKNNKDAEIITMDCANKIIYSSNTTRVFDNDFVNWRWLELYDGKNEITIEGNCEVTLQWREVRKIGEW